MSEYNNSGEITISDLVNRFRNWIRFLLRKWILFLLIGFAGGNIGLIYAYFSKPTYKAKLSFVLSAGEGSKMGALSGLAGQFGVDVGGGNSDVFSGENITSLMTSRKMLEKALFKIPKGGSQLLINLIVLELGLNTRWDNKDRTKGAFPFPSSPTSLTLIQDSLAREVYDIVANKVISVTKPYKKQSIFVAEANFTNESVTAALPVFLVNETAQFYISTKTKLAQTNLSMMQHEADSLRRLLSGTISSTASSVDNTFNLNSAYQVQRASAQEGQMKMTIVGATYSEVLKNLEIAKITLQKEMPLFQIIDEPSLPLKQQKIGKALAAVVGAIVATFIAVFAITFQKLLGSILK